MTPRSVQARWIKRGMTVEIHGRVITAGFFYFGTSLPRMGDPRTNENCLVDPSLEIDEPPDAFGRLMPYWPAYGEIEPSCRAAFLDWLAGPRNDPNTYIGYPFVNFYGLERRLMLDADCDDADQVVAEVKRLLAVFGANRSFRRYGTTLLTAYAIRFSEATRGQTRAFVCGDNRLGHDPHATAAWQMQSDWLLNLDLASSKSRAERRIEQRRANRRPRAAHAKLPASALVYRAASDSFEVPIVLGSNQRSPRVLDYRHLDIERFGGNGRPRPRDPNRGKTSLLFPLADRDDMPRIVISAAMDCAYAIPSPRAANVMLDEARLSEIRSETRFVANMLQQVFGDETTSDTLVAFAPELRVPPDTLPRLDDRHRGLLRALVARDQWSRAEFGALVRRFQLMPAAAQSAINEWTYALADDLLISGDDPLHISPHLISALELGEPK